MVKFNVSRYTGVRLIMKLWIRKISVILITIMTLGLYVPTAILNIEADENKDSFSSKENINNDSVHPVSEVQEAPIDYDVDDETFDNDYYLNRLTEKATEQVVTKLGPKISQRIEDDVLETILPNIEDVLKTVLTNSDHDTLPYYGITEEPTGGLGEKIFHVYNHQTGEDIARFHVRRDNRPREGYWFNFHYHLSEDNFEEHHELGEVYWDKNIPPRWLS